MESFKEKYNIFTLLSTTEAADVLKNNPVKVVITDQNMPDEKGLACIKRIKAEYPNVINILLTAYSSKELALQAINDVNLFKFLLKPWNYEEVENAIDFAIKEFDLQNVRLELQNKNELIVEAFKKIEENEKKYFTVFAKSQDSIYILNNQKEITEANQAFLNLFGYKDLPCDYKLLNEYIKNKFPVLIQKPFELYKGLHNSISDFEIIYSPKERKIIEIGSNEISYNKNDYILSIVRDVTERRMVEKRIVDTIIQTQEEDQSKYARELHDGLGPLLSTLKMQIEWIAHPENTNNKDIILEHSIQVIDNAIKSVKEIANNLSPHVLQRFGLVNAVKTYIDNIKEATNIDFAIASNLNERLKANVELVLYRTILECINNAAKHSEAKKINISFTKQNNFLFIGYSDNGKGFDVSKELNEGRGMGLFNMQNRIKHINGEVEIISNKTKGTDINISLDIT